MWRQHACTCPPKISFSYYFSSKKCSKGIGKKITYIWNLMQWLPWFSMIKGYNSHNLIQLEILGRTKPHLQKKKKNLFRVKKNLSFWTYIKNIYFTAYFQTSKLPVRSAAMFLHCFSFRFMYPKVPESTRVATSFRGGKKGMLQYDCF